MPESSQVALGGEEPPPGNGMRGVHPRQGAERRKGCSVGVVELGIDSLFLQVPLVLLYR